jgi:hypothetical protein
MKNPNAKFPTLTALLAIALSAVPPAAFGLGSSGFLQNQGQIEEPVRFYGPGPGTDIFFTDGAIVLDLKARDAVAPPPRGRDAAVAPASVRRGCAVYLRFEDSNPAAAPEGRGKLPGETNFFLGHDPASWRTHVASFSEVVYHDLWPGIDVVFRLEGDRLAYEFTVQSGADAARATFGYDGMDQVIQESADAWRLETPLGALRDTRTSDTSGFISLMSPPQRGALRTSEDPGRLEWCTYLGGSELDSGNAVALDSASRPVVAGLTRSFDLPATPGAYQESIGNPGILQYDAFVAKLDATGSALEWCTYLGSTGWDIAWAIAVDLTDSPIVAGETYSYDFPTTPGCFDSTKAGTTSNSDVFVTKLDPSGSALQWSTYLGAGKDEMLNALMLDPLGNVMLGGGTKSAAFPTTPGVFDTTKSYPFVMAGFVTKMSSSGNTLVWSTIIEGSNNDCVYGMTLNQLGNVSISGSTTSSDFPVPGDAYDPLHNGGEDAFVTTLSADADSLLAGTFLGTPATDFAISVAVASNGEVIVGGSTNDGTFPTTAGAYDETHNGQADVFVTALTADLDALVWSTFLGGSGPDHWPILLLDGEQCPVFGYTTESTDLPMAAVAPIDASYNGNEDPAIARLSADGDSLLWNTYFGGTGGEHFQINGIALDSNGFSIVCANWTGSSDIPVTPGAYDESFNGLEDALVYRMIPPPGTDAPERLASLGSRLLYPARPNPFTESTEIRFDLPWTAPVTVSIHDVAGRLIRTLADGPQDAGSHRLVWDGRNAAGSRVAAGVYYYRLETGTLAQSRKIVVLR